jgi:hypothetical protein
MSCQRLRLSAVDGIDVDVENLAESSGGGANFDLLDMPMLAWRQAGTR